MTKHPAQHVLAALTSQPWAITPDGLKLMIAIADRSQSDIAAVEAQLGRKLANTQSVTERDGVAVLPISGPLARHANLFSAISGATSIELLARDFNAALNNGAVRAIVLDIDSPGGEVNGTDEFAGMVYAARGTKPIYAYIGGTGCSAAYWIASAADQVVCAPTAMLGSIGVIATMQGADDENGDIEIVSSQSPRKNPDPTTEEGRSDVQATIDALASVFVSTVARNRGVDATQVLSFFGQGGVFIGADAVKAGLADKLGSYEEVVAELSGRGVRVRAATEKLAAATDTLTRILATSEDASMQSVANQMALVAAQNKPAIALAAKSKAGGASPLINWNDMTSGSETIVLPHSTASGGARAHTPTQPTKERPPMSEELDVAQATPHAPLESLGSDPMLAEQRQEYKSLLFTQMRAERESMMVQAREEVRLEFEKWKAESAIQQQIQAYSQDATSPTVRRQHALPLEANALSTFLMSIGAEQRKVAMSMFDRVLDSGLVPFEEIGSSGEGAPERTKTEEFEALVAEKVAGGMTQTAAIRAVGKAHKDLYAAYREGK